jgi:hypothetical protein
MATVGVEHGAVSAIGMSGDPLPPFPSAPDLLAPVFGFRDWRVVDRELVSPRTGVPWTSRVQRAECRPQTTEDFVRPRHPAPASDCTCGLHAYYEPSEEISKVDHRGVSGIVTVWGRVEAGARGMRAELARVEALAVYVHWTRRQVQAVLQVADKLEVDIVDLRDLREAAQEYATPLPPALLPHTLPHMWGRTASQRLLISAG